MNTVETTASCVWVSERLDAYLERDLAPSEHDAIAAHLETCGDCAAELELAKRLVHTLRDLPLLTCPETVRVAVDERIGPPPSWWRRLTGLRVWRPALAGGVAAVLVAITALVGHHQTSTTPTAEELARAGAEAKWALTYVAQVGHRAGLTVRARLSDPQLAVPLHQAIEKAQERRPQSSLSEVHHAS
jgi:anti-sigma factor RsiW